MCSRPFSGAWAVDAKLITRRQLQSSAWVRMLRGVYRHKSLDETDEVRADALRLVLPAGAVVSGRTAAWLHGVWAPRPGTAAPLEHARPVLASGSGYEGTRRRRLVYGPTLLDGIDDLSDGCVGDVVEVHGIAVSSVLRTCFELMRDRPLVEAVVVADAFAAAGALTLPWLDAYIEVHRRWPGVRQARLAVQLASPDARSAGESRLRMIVVLGGLPEPFVNVPLHAGVPPHLVGIPDLVLLDAPRPTGLEYDGAYHADMEQHVADIGRENRFAADSNLRLLRFGKNDVRERYQASLIQIAKACGFTRWQLLDNRDFRRTSPHLAW